MEFKFSELYAVKGQTGLYKISPIGKGVIKIFRLTNDESKTVFIKEHRDVTPLQSLVIFTTDGTEKPLEDIIGYIMEQEQVDPAVYDKMQDDEKREVMELLVPNHDPQKFMKSDMLKVLKWTKEIITALEILNKDVEDPYEINETDSLENTELLDQKSSKSPGHLGMHWISVAHIDDVPVGRMYCLTSDCRCYFEDDTTGECVEFGGARAQGQRIAEKMLIKNELDLLEDCTTLRWVNFSKRKPLESMSCTCRIGKYQDTVTFYVGGDMKDSRYCIAFLTLGLKFVIDEYKNDEWNDNFGDNDMYWMEEIVDNDKFENQRNSGK